MIKTIVLATKNPGKLREIREVLAPLGVAVAGLEEFPPIAEPEETGSTFAENARQKAQYYAQQTHQWCLADDSGLVVDALGGAPGVHSARYAAGDCPPGSPREVIDQANNRKLLDELRETHDPHRTARFVCHLALSDGQNILIEASDAVEGRIGYQSRGSNGFGYDPLFYLPGRDCTTAQLPSTEKNLISHRGKALRKFADKLAEMLARP